MRAEGKRPGPSSNGFRGGGQRPGSRTGPGWSLAPSRRVRLAVVVGAVLLVAVAVALDLDRRASPAEQAQAFEHFNRHVAAGVAACSDAFDHGLALYRLAAAGNGDRAAAARYELLAEPECTAEGNTDLLVLATQPVPRSLAGAHLNQVITDLGLWAYPNAAASLLDMATLLEHPGDRTARAGLQGGLAGMRDQAAAAEQVLATAAARFGAPLDPLRLAPDS